MRILKFVLATFITLLSLTLLTSFQQSKTSTIYVHIEGLRNNDGQIMLSLNRGPKDFPDSNFYIQLFIKEFDAPNHTIIIPDIPYGDYAISMMHDENESGEMDYNFIGMPVEGFAFSRNYKVVFRSPKYDEANVKIDESEHHETLYMQY